MGKLAQLIRRLTGNIPEGHLYYDGEYHESHAQYYYVLSGDKHIFDGSFSCEYKYGGGLGKKAVGNFKMDKKTGEWEFTRRGNGSLMQLYATFDEGYLSGDFDYLYEEVTIGAIAKTDLSLSLDRGEIRGKISGHFDGGELDGYCDADGYPNGAWKLTFREGDVIAEEHIEHWEHGVLIDAYVDDKKWHRKNDVSPRLRERVNYLLDHDCRRLLTTVGRGTLGTLPHIRRVH